MDIRGVADIFGNVRDKASNITWRYATPCRPITDSKVNDLECLYFMSKCVFDVQGGRALTLALAGLSCMY